MENPNDQPDVLFLTFNCKLADLFFPVINFTSKLKHYSKAGGMNNPPLYQSSLVPARENFLESESDLFSEKI